jgi:hypothetical protein
MKEKEMIKNEANKKGQITIFIIIAVVIVGGVIAIFLVSDKARGVIDRITGAEFDVKADLKNCIENNKEIKEKISVISSQGGSTNPQANYMYEGKKFEYLCYTNQNFDTCIMQQPMILNKVESEINKQIAFNVNECFKSTKSKLENRGYSTSLVNGDTSTKLIPESLIIKSDISLTASRNGKNTYTDFEFRIPSQLYGLVMLSTSILNFEARYGDSDPAIYMTLYPDIKVEKEKQGDGTTLYFVSDRNTGEQFNFASRSLVYPVGYG